MDVFYKQLPEFELFWYLNLKSYSILTVDGIFSGNYPTHTAKAFGQIWSANGKARIGAVESTFEYRRSDVEATSASIVMKLDRAAVAEIRGDKLPIVVYPEVRRRKEPQSVTDQALITSPVNHLGDAIQSELRSMKPSTLRRTTIAGMETTLALDAELNLELTLRTALPNPYFPAIAPYDREPARRFSREKLARIKEVLSKKVFKPRSVISRRVTLAGSILRSDGGGYAQLLVEAESGKTFGVNVLDQPNQNSVEVSVFVNGWIDTRERDAAYESAIRPEFVAYISNRMYGSATPTHKYRAVEHMFLSWETDIPDLLDGSIAPKVSSR